MKATAWEFKYRFWILVVVYVLGFVAPWDIWWHLDGSGPNAHVWARLAVMLSRGGAMNITRGVQCSACGGDCVRGGGSVAAGLGRGVSGLQRGA